MAALREGAGCLQHEGGFTDAGITAYEYDGGRDEATAENAVKFCNGGADAWGRLYFTIQPHGIEAP
ncbi:hypothetical protein AA106556_0989 [Neokomagataea tanensis NBRC 106556]|uniref:Uncharacterized protein n=1 Tax=Neokomagataea tanensis NBRC 106556 TaxID=1223519 RepID=A0ABQ0QIJ5_9PROT|nr:hypothetical protein AA106556_0989 [Neokomagataea tanensis NBRC 106556]